jgi:formylglycine-generating enzyme required for sulfatase activity
MNLRVPMLGVLLAAVLAGQTQPSNRRALLIGNSTYRALPAIPQVAEEMKILEAALAKAGFAVTVARDIRLPDFPQRTLPAFLATVKPGDICLIYFNGHAVQAEGDNLILPVDFDPADRRPITSRAYSFLNLPVALDEKKASLKMLVVEASRSIDVAIPGVSGLGLGSMELGDFNDMLYASSAQPNQVIEKTEKPGLFTRALAEAIQKKGSDPLRVFADAQRTIAQQTQQRQSPSFFPKLTQTFYFLAPEEVKPEIVVVEKPVIITKSEGPTLGTLKANRRDRQEYVWLPAGKFLMGCVPNDNRCEGHEKPQREVTLTKPFWMGRTEVTVEAYQRFSEATKTKMPGGPLWDTKWRNTAHPMNSMSWEDASAFCGWIGGRLPTEAEWEYAARGGVPNEVVPLNNENSREKANFTGKKGNDRYEYTAPVRSFDANPFGLYDMSGNVWEFVSDFYAENYFAGAPKVDPRGPESGKDHVVRGGSWDSDPNKHLRISFRRPWGAGNIVGFRCAMDDNEETRKILDIR